MATLQIFIPRILSRVSAEFMKQTFVNMNVGKITNLDMRSRINSYNYHYSFAFITVEMFHSDFANLLLQKIKTNGHAQLVYDDYNYWEIKEYIPREKRVAYVPQYTEPTPEWAIEAEPTPEWAIEAEPTPEWAIEDESVDTDKSKFMQWFDNRNKDVVFPPEPSIKELCNDLMYGSITKKTPSISKSPEYLLNDVKDFEEMQREINATILASSIPKIKYYSLF